MAGRFGLTIRAADAGDVDGLVELMRSAGESATREQLAVRMAALREHPGVVLLADEWGPPTGVLAAAWTPTLTADLRRAEITLLLVDPERRRSGVARLLLKSASQAARLAGCDQMVLSFPQAASDLRAFALATGFSPTFFREYETAIRGGSNLSMRPPLPSIPAE